MTIQVWPQHFESVYILVGVGATHKSDPNDNAANVWATCECDRVPPPAAPLPKSK